MKGKIFNAQEVQAIIAGNKTMFREVIKQQPISSFKPQGELILIKGINRFCQLGSDEKYENYHWHFGASPYQVGQKIFCKESFENVGKINYKAQTDIDYPNYKPISTWKPAQHMKQEHSRLTLLIKEIRVERLASISEEDCWKEGLEELADYQDQVKVCQMAKQLGECIEDPRPHFATYWNATYKKPEEKFEANPWVWCVSFEKTK